MTPTRLTDLGPSTIAAWRFKAQTPTAGGPRHYDVALVRSEDERHVYFACDCPDAVFRDRRCKHVMEAQREWAAENRRPR